MRARGSTLAKALSAALLALPGCATSPAPKGWLPPAERVAQDPRGAWIKVERPGHRALDGELIAVGDDGVSILTAQGLVVIPSGTIKRATLAFHADETSRINTWGALGALSTASHGAYLVFTLPIWAAVATATGHAESRAPLVVHPPAELASFRKYARFPQGLPAGLDPAALGPARGKQRRPVRE